MSMTLREGYDDDVIVVLTRNGVVVDLSTIQRATFYLINILSDTTTTLDTLDNPTEIVVTKAVNGEITITALPTFWSPAGHYRAYTDIILLSGKRRSFPSNRDEDITIVESAP